MEGEIGNMAGQKKARAVGINHVALEVGNIDDAYVSHRKHQ